MPIPFLIPAMVGFVGAAAAASNVAESCHATDPVPTLPPDDRERTRMAFLVGRQDGLTAPLPEGAGARAQARRVRWDELYEYAFTEGFAAGRMVVGKVGPDSKSHRPPVPPVGPRAPLYPRPLPCLSFIPPECAYTMGVEHGVGAARRHQVQAGWSEAERAFSETAAWSAWNDGFEAATSARARPPWDIE